MSQEPTGGQPIVVHIDPELRPLIAGFLEKRRAEVTTLRDRVAEGDLDGLQAAGHSLKGLGGGYGFEELSELGRSLEAHAKDGDLEAVRSTITAIADYVDHVQVVYDDA